MSHVQYVDELVKEYLLFRGFSQTLKAFDNDLKAEKEKGFRVRVVMFIYVFIHKIYYFINRDILTYYICCNIWKLSISTRCSMFN